MMPSQHRRFQFIRGFTLIEVMVVVAIIGILAAIALPSYTDYIRKSKRADGIAAILSLQLAQEKFRANCVEYAQAMDPNSTNYKCDNTDPTTNVVTHLKKSIDDHYTLDNSVAVGAGITGANATGYTITAIPQGDQTNDSCGNFILEVDGGTVEKSTSVYTNPDSSEAKRCWAH